MRFSALILLLLVAAVLLPSFAAQPCKSKRGTVGKKRGSTVRRSSSIKPAKRNTARGGGKQKASTVRRSSSIKPAKRNSVRGGAKQKASTVRKSLSIKPAKRNTAARGGEKQKASTARKPTPLKTTRGCNQKTYTISKMRKAQFSKRKSNSVKPKKPKPLRVVKLGVNKKSKVKVLQPKVVKRGSVRTTLPKTQKLPKTKAKSKGKGTLKISNSVKHMKNSVNKIQQKIRKGLHKVSHKVKQVKNKVLGSSSKGKRPTGPSKEDMTYPQLKQLMNQPVSKMRVVHREMSTTKYLPNLERINPDWSNMHSGVEVITADGGRYLIHKAYTNTANTDKYGRVEGGDTVVTDAKHMSSAWKQKSPWQSVTHPTQVTDFVKAGGKHYDYLNNNCHKASRTLKSLADKGGD